MAAQYRLSNLGWTSIAILMLLQLSSVVYSQPPAAGGLVFRGRARLFIADNSPQNPSVAIVDLPGFNLTQRIQLPGTALQIGASHDSAHVGVFRNRDNSQQFFSVIGTGILPIVPAAGTRPTAPAPLRGNATGLMRPAFLSKNIIFVNGSDAIGGVDGGTLTYHVGWRLYLAYAEAFGRIFTYRVDDLQPVAAFKPAATFQLPVGHFHAVPYGNFIIVPHTGANRAYILDSKGKIVSEHNCPACHGAATYVSPQGALTAVFGCNETVLVVRNISTNGTHVAVSSPRIGSFVDGVPGVFWSSNSAQRFFWRTDVRGAVPRVTNVTHRGGIIRMASLLSSQGRFVAVHNDGFLVMYDGDSGAVLTSILLRAGGFPANQTAPSLQSDMAGEHVFVSVPALGVVHVVHVEYGGHEGHNHGPGEEPGDEAEPANMELERTIAVGGMPTAMTLAYLPGVVSLGAR